MLTDDDGCWSIAIGHPSTSSPMKKAKLYEASIQYKVLSSMNGLINFKFSIKKGFTLS